MKKAPKKRWKWETKIWRFDIDVTEHINTQCLSFGLCLNWNFRPSFEIDFMFWRLHVEYN